MVAECRPRFSRPCANWDAPPPAPASPRPSRLDRCACGTGRRSRSARCFSIARALRRHRRHWKIALCSLSTGSKRRVVLLRLGGDELAGADQHFFVGERDQGAAPHRRQGRRETGRADDRRHHPIGRTRAPPRPPPPVPAGRLDAGAGERRLSARAYWLSSAMTAKRAFEALAPARRGARALRCATSASTA